MAPSDQRDEFERDRDRILYSSAFRRLAGITQIVRAGEADVFHTRQEHTIKVAQVGRRLAQHCIKVDEALADDLGLHAEVVEAACLAHDLGHPPFGHIGEYQLHDMLLAADDVDGFEGNAQSFRIITKLAVRFEQCSGLDLTRATLAATLKYPWHRDIEIAERAKKWGAYQLDAQDFTFARQGFAHSAKTAEAELMDWADDIAYSVHDLEDFHRCGMVPWTRVLGGDQAEALVQRAVDTWFNAPPDAGGRLRTAVRRLQDLLFDPFEQVIEHPYDGGREQRQQLRQMTSILIGRYLTAVRLQAPDQHGVCVRFDEKRKDEVRILKQVARDYIHMHPTLVAQQFGQKRIVKNLFEDISKHAEKGPPSFLPKRLRYLWEEDISRYRFAADCICSLTEAEATALHARLQGTASGSVLDPIVR